MMVNKLTRFCISECYECDISQIIKAIDNNNNLSALNLSPAGLIQFRSFHHTTLRTLPLSDLSALAPPIHKSEISQFDTTLPTPQSEHFISRTHPFTFPSILASNHEHTDGKQKGELRISCMYTEPKSSRCSAISKSKSKSKSEIRNRE